MDQLLLCDACNHGAISHDGSGCDVPRCRCAATREELVAVGIEAAREEIRALWERQPGTGSASSAG